MLKIRDRGPILEAQRAQTQLNQTHDYLARSKTTLILISYNVKWWLMLIILIWSLLLQQLKTERDIKKQRFREAYMSLYF